MCYLGTVQPVSACSQHAIAATRSQLLRHDQTAWSSQRNSLVVGLGPGVVQPDWHLDLVCADVGGAQLERRGWPVWIDYTSGGQSDGVGWEGAGRTAEKIAAAGWCGALTSPRELLLTDGAVISRPAAELTRLRQETIDYQPGTTLELSAYEVSARNGLQLRLIDTAGRQQLVAEAVGPVRLLVDGSLVELCGPATPHTTRAYPTPTTTG